MKRILVLLGLISSFVHCDLMAQFINNKVDVDLSYGFTLPLGTESVSEQNYNTPSLFRGYSNGHYYSLAGIYNYHSNYSLGVTCNKISFTKWAQSDSDLFTNSSSNISSFGPLIKLHTKFKQTGIQNKAQLFAIVSPYIAFIKSSLYQSNIFSIEPVHETTPVIESAYSSYGVKINIGAKHTITQNIDFNIEIGGNYTNLESQFYNDKCIIWLNFGAGITFKLVRNKKFYL